MPNNHTNIKLRRGTAAEWAAANELLLLGEPGFEKDTYKLKIGDGVTLWNDLPYIAGGMGGSNGPLSYTYNTDFTTIGGSSTTLSSDLTSLPEWLSVYEAETGFTQDGSLPGNAFGFDGSGLWFTGDAQPASQSYPVRTNFNIPSETTTTIVFTVNHNDSCADQGVCFYRDGDAPQWNWGSESSRIAIQVDCPQPMIAGLSSQIPVDTESGGSQSLGSPGFYTFEITYNPSASSVTLNVYSGQDTSGALLETLSLNERLPEGDYRIGFVSDQDDGTTKSYFSNLTISYGNPITQLVLSSVSSNINFTEFFQQLIDSNQISNIKVTNVSDSNNFGIFNAATPRLIGSNFVFDVTPQVSNLTLTNDDQYYINIDIIGSASDQTLKVCSLQLVGNQYYAGDPVIVYQQDSTVENKVYDNIDTDITLTRGSWEEGGGGLYNSKLQEDYDDNGPTGTEWNADGWDDLSDITTRSYQSLYDALDEAVGKNITNAELVMHDTINDKYYKFDFTYWQPGGGQQAGPNYPIGGFRYVRTPLWVAQEPVSFTRPPNDDSVVDNIDSGLTIKRNNGAGGIFNAESETGWDVSKSPEGTLWNIEGWDDLSNVANRQYVSFYAATGGQLGNMVTTRQYIMKDTINNKYYKVQFSNWGGGNGSFEYTRELINGYCQGNITFGDGSIQNTAYTPSAVSGIVENTLSTSLVAGSGIDLNYDSGNNTLTINNKITVVDLGSVSGSINTDASLGNIFDLTLAASGILSNPTNSINGQTLRWRISHGANSLTINLDNKFVIPSSASSPLPFSSTSGVMDLLGATYDSNRDKWDIIAFVPGY